MKKGSKASESALKVREVHGMIMDSLDSYLGSISVADLIKAYEDQGNAKAFIADALDCAAAELRA